MAGEQIIFRIAIKGEPSTDDFNGLKNIFLAIGFDDAVAEKITRNTVLILKHCKKADEAEQRVKDYYFNSNVGNQMNNNSIRSEMIKENGKWFLAFIKTEI